MAKVVLTVEEALQLAADHTTAGNFEPAESIYRSLLAKFPQNDYVEASLAKVLDLKSQGTPPAPSPAVIPSSLEDRQTLETLFKEEKFAEVEAMAARLLPAHPRDFVLYTFMGGALWRQDKLDDSIAYYKKAIEIQPTSVTSHFGIATAFMRQEKPQDAIGMFHKTIALEPRHLGAQAGMAEAQRQLGDFTGASASLMKCIAMQPDNLALHHDLLRTLVRTGDLETANIWASTQGLPLMQRLAAQENFKGMSLLLSIYYTFLKIQDTEEQYAEFCVPVMNVFYQAVHHAESLKPAVPLNVRPATGKKRRVAFFAETLTSLAHTRNLFNYTRAVHAREDLDVQPVIYYGVAGSNEDITQYQNAGIEIYALPNWKDLVKSGHWLRDHLRETGTDVCVILGTISGPLIFFLGMRVAPVQIWWCQKYHGLKLENIDGYLTLGGFEPVREVQGRPWRCIPGLFGPEITAPADAETMATVNQVRADLLGSQFSLMAGVIGREEKLDNDEYWNCIAAIMNKHPEMLFIWSGHTQRDSIQRRIDVRGLTARVRFVGWVDTKVYANAVDLYLDSFPFPGGHTLIQAMMANKPAVTLVTKEGRRIGIPIFAEPWLKNDGGVTLQRYGFEPIFNGPDGEDLLPFVADTKTYVERALALIENPAFKARWIAASRRFVEQYLTDMKRPADMLNMHIMEVIHDRERLLKDS